jgi:hypothetical protein
VLVFSSLFIQLFVLFCFVFCQGVSLPRGQGRFILGVAGGIPCDAWRSPVGLLNVSQAGLEPAVVGALLFSQCNVVWRSFHRLGVQGVEVLVLFGALFLPTVAPVSQQGF